MSLPTSITSTYRVPKIDTHSGMVVQPNLEVTQLPETASRIRLGSLAVFHTGNPGRQTNHGLVEYTVLAVSRKMDRRTLETLQSRTELCW